MSSQPSFDIDVKMLRDAVREGDDTVLDDFLVRCRPRLRRMVQLRLDRRVQSRLDPSDVIQDAYMEASKRIADYVRSPTIPPFLWLRCITIERIIQLHRHHLGVQARAVTREISLYHGTYVEATSAAIAASLVGEQTSPSEAAARSELRLQVEEALNELNPIDREILALRHFEHLTNTEVAQILDLSIGTASKRYTRALGRMKGVLSKLGFMYFEERSQ